jgi:prepilin-type N-terminal cleavage/methylation domain-containing protein/prepilin-type processing-associated H-X9-DG protein
MKLCNAHNTKHRAERGTAVGFTLIEMLVVIAIVGVLLGLLLPALQAARETSRRSRCANNLHQMGIALQSYHAKHGRFPAGSNLLPVEWQPSISWRVMILPFLEESVAYEQIHPTPDGGAADWSAKSLAIDVMHCPSAPPPSIAASAAHVAYYTGVGGAGRNEHRVGQANNSCGDISTDGLMFPGSHTRIAQIEDGTSHTLAIGERTYILWDWMSGAYWVDTPTTRICTGATNNVRYPINADLNQFGYYVGDGSAPPSAKFAILLNDVFFGSYHPDGAQFGYADGHVEMLHDTIDFTMFGDLSTIAGSETNKWEP